MWPRMWPETHLQTSGVAAQNPKGQVKLAYTPVCALLKCVQGLMLLGHHVVKGELRNLRLWKLAVDHKTLRTFSEMHWVYWWLTCRYISVSALPFGLGWGSSLYPGVQSRIPEPFCQISADVHLWISAVIQGRVAAWFCAILGHVCHRLDLGSKDCFAGLSSHSITYISGSGKL